MAKGIGNRRDVRKKPNATLKEKRLRKREKKFKHDAPEHQFDQPLE